MSPGQGRAHAVLPYFALGARAALPRAGAGAGETQTPIVAVQPRGAGRAQPTLGELLWVARPLVVFADTPGRSAVRAADADARGGPAELEERDVVVLTDTDPAASGPLRRELRPRGFGLVLIDKDGTVAQRRPAPDHGARADRPDRPHALAPAGDRVARP